MAVGARKESPVNLSNGPTGKSKDRTLALSRRAFLQWSGRLGLGALAVTAGGRLLPRLQGARAAEPSGVREIHLEARELIWEAAPGVVARAMALNGQIPGPEIRVREGERVRIVLKNSLPDPTSLHWHGVDVPNSMDGVPGLTQEPVASGRVFVYEFEARPSGTRWYHTHFDSVKQLDRGLFGPLIIEPAQSDPFPFDREYTVVLDDWVTGAGPWLPRTEGGTAGRRGEAGGMMSRMGGMGGMMQEMMGGSGPVYDTLTINGKAYPTTRTLPVRKGERVRLRVLNGSADHTHLLRLAGHTLQVTHTDGNPLEHPVEVDALPIAPSERYDVNFVADRPGAWFLHCAEPGHAAAGEQVPIVYEGYEKAQPAAAREGIAGLRLWNYVLGSGRDVLPAPSGRTHRVELGLSGGMMGSDIWTINGKQYPETDPVSVRTGDRVTLLLSNHSMEAHPMHLHGQSFKVTAVNGWRLSKPLVKDSVDVEPHMGSVEVEFTAHNPGNWFFHCHKPMHMDGGMAMLVKIA